MTEHRKPSSAYLQLIAISWNFGWPVAVGVILGSWLDEKLGTSPGVTLFLGMGSLVVSVWRLIQLSKQEERAHVAADADAARGAEAQERHPDAYERSLRQDELDDERDDDEKKSDADKPGRA